ncbi:ATPase [Mesorhizobium sanjuanii]|uniref:ATPase n=1 Tax=Mesorhizobium sanjuanii TaxID=2037900 RepID=A0A2A6FIU2_9HYPH|nr:ABC transporter permease [Mesorhizobium sanjuanii]PDQ21744.1 ATPase [Mesorhizobium sanjuanii]
MTFSSLRRLPLFRGQEAGLVAVIFGLSVAFSFFNPNFLSTDNLRNVLVAVAVVGIMSIGQTFVIIAREIDLSVGSVMGLSGLCGAYAMSQGLNPILGICLAIAVGAAAGLVNGLIVVYGRVNSFIATLGMLSVARGLTQVISGGLPIMVDPSVMFIGQGALFDVPVQVLIFVGLVIVGQIVLKRSVLGQRIIAVGDNDEAARLSGIPLNATRVAVFVFSGVLAAVAGMVYTAQVSVAEAQAGTGLELDVIAAVVIGGASLSGGRGSILGAMLGAYLLGALRNAFILLELSPFLQQMSVGLVIVLAALFDQFRQGAFRHAGIAQILPGLLRLRTK